MENEIKNGVNMGKNKFKKTKCGLIPEDWECVRLGEVCEVITKGATPLSHKKNNSNYKIKFIKIEAIDSNGNILKSKLSFINESMNSGLQRSVLFKDDILFSIAGRIGRVAMVNASILPANINQAIALIRLKNKEMKNFIFHYLISSKMKLIIRKISVQGAQVNISLKDVSEFKIPLPPLKEQEKIAEILETWDNVIEKIDKLIETKEEYKKGLMQQLLTGRMRFPGFGKPAKNKNELPENWKRVKLGEVGEIKKGEYITQSIVCNGDIPVIAGGIKPAYYHNMSNRNKNTITVSSSGANAGFIQLHRNPIFASDCVTIGIKNINTIMYVYYYLKFYQRQIFIMKIGGAQPHIYPKHLINFKISLPPLKEQEKIAEILENIDNEIELLKKEKETYEIQKKGLMQQLLTGRIRVRIN